MFCGIIGMIAIMTVTLVAHAAEVKVENNRLATQNQELQGEIDTLKVKIKTENNISNIEAIAKGKLGMVYPEKGECVYLSEEKAPGTNLATIIMKNAYN